MLFDTLFAGADPSRENRQLRDDLTTFLRGIIGLPLPVPWCAYRKALRAGIIQTAGSLSERLGAWLARGDAARRNRRFSFKRRPDLFRRTRL